MQTVTLAIFDVDHTLIQGDSLLWFGKFLLARRLPCFSEIPLFVARSLGYVAHAVDAGQVKASFLRVFASGLRAVEMSSLVDEFAKNILVPRLCRQAKERIHWHQTQGHQVVFLSASPASYLEGLARALEVKSVIATQLKWRDGVFCGDLEGANCKGEEKLARLLANYQGQVVDWPSSYYYADSSSDIPVFEQVGHPVMINPKPALAQTGTPRQWPIERWS